MRHKTVFISNLNNLLSRLLYWELPKLHCFKHGCLQLFSLFCILAFPLFWPRNTSWDVSWELSWGVLQGLKTGQLNPRGCCRGRSCGRTRGPTRGLTRWGYSWTHMRGSNFGFACSVLRPSFALICALLHSCASFCI